MFSLQLAASNGLLDGLMGDGPGVEVAASPAAAINIYAPKDMASDRMLLTSFSQTLASTLQVWTTVPKNSQCLTNY